MLDIVTENHYSVITVNNPPVNALSHELVARLSDALCEMNENGKNKAIAITGAGRFFCAGADIKEIAAIKKKREGERFSKNGRNLMDMIEKLNIPVIAAVNGACIGGGNELAMACHLRIAADTAWFSQPEINLGIIPGFGGTQRLQRLIGMTKTLEMILTGDSITAREALDLGLINRVVEPERLMDEAKSIASKIANKGKTAIGSCLKAIYGREDEYKLFGNVCETADKEEGIKAFMEKRMAVFKDR